MPLIEEKVLVLDLDLDLEDLLDGCSLEANDRLVAAIFL